MKLLSSVSHFKSSNPWQAGGMFQLLIDWSREETFVVIIQFKLDTNSGNESTISLDRLFRGL